MPSCAVPGPCMATADTADGVPVEVAFALPDRQVVIPLRVPVGSDAGQAIRESGILRRFPEIDLAQHRIGVFGRLCSLERVLEAGDRVEIYRPLKADPKEVRRQLAAAGRSMGQRKGGRSDEPESG